MFFVCVTNRVEKKLRFQMISSQKSRFQSGEKKCVPKRKEKKNKQQKRIESYWLQQSFSFDLKHHLHLPSSSPRPFAAISATTPSFSSLIDTWNEIKKERNLLLFLFSIRALQCYIQCSVAVSWIFFSIVPSKRITRRKFLLFFFLFSLQFSIFQTKQTMS